MDDEKLRGIQALIQLEMNRRNERIAKLEIDDPDVAKLLHERDLMVTTLAAFASTGANSHPSQAVERERARLRAEYDDLVVRHGNLQGAYRRLLAELNAQETERRANP